MFGFLKSKKAEVLEHWIAFVEGFQLSSSEFYDLVESELKLREVPGMEMARVEFAEGSILSDKRLYLRSEDHLVCVDLAKKNSHSSLSADEHPSASIFGPRERDASGRDRP